MAAAPRSIASYDARGVPFVCTVDPRDAPGPRRFALLHGVDGLVEQQTVVGGGRGRAEMDVAPDGERTGAESRRRQLGCRALPDADGGVGWSSDRRIDGVPQFGRERLAAPSRE